MSNSMLWPLAPHTHAKHQILRSYLGGWFPILASSSGRIVFIDGFAGPGRYSGGEPGSPLIALDVARNHPSDLSNNEVIFLFIEDDRARFEHLNGQIQEIRRESLPANFIVAAEHGQFADHLSTILDSLEGKGMAPAFVMIDPFGVKGVPYSIVERLAGEEKTEVLISFMYESMTRFLTTQEFEPHLDNLFGTPEWRQAIPLQGNDRREFLSQLYDEQLQRAGFRVASFLLLDDRNRPEYFLKFGTHHPKGMRLMKDAMAKVDVTGNYEFSDATANQPRLFKPEPDYSHLANLIFQQYAGTTARIDDIEDWVAMETKTFRAADVRTALRLLESDRRIESVRTPRGNRRGRTYPTGSEISFAGP